MGLLNYAGKFGAVSPAYFFYRLIFKLMQLPKKYDKRSIAKKFTTKKSPETSPFYKYGAGLFQTRYKDRYKTE